MIGDMMGGLKGTDTSTTAAAIGTAIDVATGIATLSGMIADVALTGVSGGAVGGQTFTGTGGVIGRVVSGDANFQAQTMIVNVSGTTITVDRPLLGAIAAATMNSHVVLVVDYAK